MAGSRCSGPHCKSDWCCWCCVVGGLAHAALRMTSRPCRADVVARWSRARWELHPCAHTVPATQVDAWEAEGIFPAHELFKKMGDNGFLGVTKPEKFGGLGLDYRCGTPVALPCAHRAPLLITVALTSSRVRVGACAVRARAPPPHSYGVAMAEELGNISCGGVPMAIGVQVRGGGVAWGMPAWSHDAVCCVCGNICVRQTDMATPALAKFGSDSVRERFLAPSIAGDFVACLGVSATHPRALCVCRYQHGSVGSQLAGAAW